MTIFNFNNFIFSTPTTVNETTQNKETNAAPAAEGFAEYQKRFETILLRTKNFISSSWKSRIDSSNIELCTREKQKKLFIFNKL